MDLSNDFLDEAPAVRAGGKFQPKAKPKPRITKSAIVPPALSKSDSVQPDQSMNIADTGPEASSILAGTQESSKKNAPCSDFQLWRKDVVLEQDSFEDIEDTAPKRLEMPSVLLMAALQNVQIARPTMYQVVRDMVDKMGYTVPIQVNKYLAYSDGMRVVESGKLATQFLTSDGLYVTELDRPGGQPCLDTKEFNLVINMVQAVNQERYDEAAEWRDKLTQFRAKRNLRKFT